MFYFYLPKRAAVVTETAQKKGAEKHEAIVGVKQIKIVINPICYDIDLLLENIISEFFQFTEINQVHMIIKFIKLF